MNTNYCLPKITLFLAIALAFAANASAAGNPLFCASIDGVTCPDTVSITLSATPAQVDPTDPVHVYILTNRGTGVAYSAVIKYAATPPALWMSISCNFSTTPDYRDDCGISGHASSVTTPQTLTAAITLTSTNLSPQVAITINVTFNVGTSGGGTTTTGTLQPSPASVSLSYPSGTNNASVTVNAASGSGTASFYATLAIQAGGQWVTLACPNGTSCNSQAQPVGSVLTLTVDPTVAQTLSTTVYYGTVTLSNALNSSDQTVINVSLSVNGASGTGTGTGTGTGACTGAGSATIAAPASLSFAYSAGSAMPASQVVQTILVNGSNVAATFNSDALPNFIQAAVGGNMILVTVLGSMPVGRYTGSVTVTSSLGCQSIPVTLTVYNGAVLIASPGTIAFESRGGASNSQTLSLTSGDGATQMAITAITTAPWVTLSPPGCGVSTPASCTVSINASALPSCLNTASINVMGRNSSNLSVTIPVVVLADDNCTSSGVLTLSSPLLAFTSTVPQTLSVSAPSSPITFTAGSQTSACGTGWVNITPSGTLTYSGTPISIQVSIVPSNLTSGLAAGTQCAGEVDLTPDGGNKQVVRVTYSLPSATVVVTSGNSPGGSAVSSLSFTAQAGGSSPSPQYLYVSGGAAAGFSYSSSDPWLLVNGSQNGYSTIPASLPVTVNPAALTAGPYSGTITIGSSTVSVSLTVTPAPSVSASSTSLNFTYTAGGTTPPSQTINVSGGGAALAFTATTSSSGNWLVVSPSSGVTALDGTVTLTVSLANLASLEGKRTYDGIIVVAGMAGASGHTTISVSLTVTAPLPTILAVTNTASGNAGPVSAGEMISIFGTGLGPTQGVAFTSDLVSDNRLQTAAGLGGVQVLVGGYPAPLLYASATQVDAIVPYEINSPSYLLNPAVIVRYLGQTSNGFAETQAAAAPGIFTAKGTGSGPGAILNSDNSPNCGCAAGRPANKGEAVVLYVTGEGQTLPAGKSGTLTPMAPPYPQPVLAPAVTINGQPAQVLFYAEAPGLVAGILQINVRIPPDASSGDLPVVVSFGNANSQTSAGGTGAVTVAVK